MKYDFPTVRRIFPGLFMVILSLAFVPYLVSQPQILGFVAASCTTLSFLPQVLHTLKTKNTEGISLVMYLMFVFGVFCWLVYGFKSHDLPLMIGNGITLILASVVLVMKMNATIKGGEV